MLYTFYFMSIMNVTSCNLWCVVIMQAIEQRAEVRKNKLGNNVFLCNARRLQYTGHLGRVVKAID